MPRDPESRRPATAPPRLERTKAPAASSPRQVEHLLAIQRDLGVVLGGVSDLLPAAASVLEAVLRIEGFDCGGVYAVDRTSGALELLVTRGLSAQFVDRVRSFPADSPNTKVILRGEPLYRVYDDLIENVIQRDHSDPNRLEGLRAIAVVPILHRETVIGCINGASHSTTDIPESSRQALESIASRVGMAIARIRAEEDLRASEERFRAMYENAIDGILLTDAVTRRFQDGNRAICGMLGYTIEELRSLAVDDIHPPEALPLALSHFERQVRSISFAAPDLPVLRKDGTVFHADVNSSVVTLQGRRILMGIFRDVTERRRLQSEILKAQRLESVGLLAGGIAHDFNNILTGISGNLSLARLLADGDAGLTELFDEAERATRRAGDLTRQLLTFAKGGSPVRRTASAGDLIRESAEFILRGSRARLLFSPPEGLRAVDVDPGQIGQVIQNLVLNASQSMPEGGVVEVVAANVDEAGDAAPSNRPGGYVRISVTDRGCGIPPENLARVFDPYFTTKETGSGLGLAVCYSIITKHDGRIDVESRVGSGTTFHVYLPAADGALWSEPRASSSEPPATGRVLLMDDDPMILKVASRMLETLGYRVSRARDGAEAVEAFREARDEGLPFDIAILDLTVPAGMGGVACSAELRRIDPGVKLVVSSGYSTDPAMAEPERYGFRAVITKPYRLADLQDALRGLG